MTNIAQINNTQVSIVNFKSIPVITTEMMADFYGTESKNIQNNFLRNSKRFIEGKHFFKIIGQELKDFKNQPSLRGLVNKRVSHLTLWTERGAARHAKMLDTDQAWDIFEQLEDCYFHRQEVLAKTHKSERTALHEAHALLITKTKHLNVNEAWKLIHQRFNVNHIEDIPYDAIPVAVEYVHHLIALYSSANKHAGLFDKDAYELVRHLCERVILENEEVVAVLEKFRGILDSRKFLFYANYIVRSNEAVRNLSRLLDFKNKHDQPLIDVNCKTIALSTGQRFITNPNWFNAPA